MRAQYVYPKGIKKCFYQELQQGMAALCPNSLTDADPPSAFSNRNEHDIHYANAANEQRNVDNTPDNSAGDKRIKSGFLESMTNLPLIILLVN